MREEMWQAMVGLALAERLELSRDHMLAEVQVVDGSIADLLYVGRQRLVAFELKMGDPGEALARLDARALRQLRHFREACDAVWLVTVAAPRQLTFGMDLRVVVEQPLEAQALPEGVGWIVFDQLSHQVTPVVAAPELSPDPFARAHLVDVVQGRLGRVLQAVKRCRP